MINNQTTIFDVTYSRHTGNAESIAANKKAHSSKHWIKQDIIEVLKANRSGLTSKEIAAILDKPLNAISGRFSELKADKIIKASGSRRNGCAVLILNK